jgi:hypothetical protein
LRFVVSVIFFRNLAFIDKVYRDWELAWSTNKFSGASGATVLQPWGVSVDTVLGSISSCVRYSPTAASNSISSAALPTNSSDPKAYQAAVNEAQKAKEAAVAAAKDFGATPAQADETRKAIDELNKEMGLILVGAK